MKITIRKETKQNIHKIIKNLPSIVKHRKNNQIIIRLLLPLQGMREQKLTKQTESDSQMK